MSEYRACPSCGRQILVTVFDRANAHAPGCKIRRSVLAKANYAKKQERLERARKAAETRRQRKAQRSAI
jgi:hypothetical protein